MAIDTKRGLKIAQKIQYLLSNIDTNIDPVEKDLLLGYIRSLYDLVLFDENTNQASKSAAKQAKSAKKAKKANKEVVVRVEVAQPPSPKPVAVAPPPPKPKPVAVAPPPPPAPKSVLAEHQELFAFKEATDLSEKLQDRPVKDLNKAFSINDRLLTTSKLFGGDTEAFKETLIKLNSLNSFDEAKIYLSQYIVDSFQWMDKSRFKTAKVFMKTIRRRYL